jgi:hypothetical protein
VTERSYIWQPQPGPQRALIYASNDIEEIFYGGARGGGKTDGALGDWLAHEAEYGAGARGLFVRRVAEDLADVVLRSHMLFPLAGASWNGTQRTWTFPSGSVLRLRHLKDALAAQHYQGHAYTRIYYEEAGQWPTPEAYLMMRGALRPPAGSRTPCRVISTGNPGGPGHNWLKARFVDPAPRGFHPLTDPVSGHRYVFIPAKLEDNRLLMQADPGYDARLRIVGNSELVKAWRFGVWDLVIGSYFAEVWRPDRQELPNNLVIPDSWGWRRSFDWGSAKPSSLGIWAISSGEPIREGPFTNRVFPRGSMIRVGEWYTAETDHMNHVVPNKGLRLSNTVLGQGIAKLSQHFRSSGGWDGCVADGEIFKDDGGESIFYQMRRGAHQESHDLVMSPADKRRVPGWQRMFQMLHESAQEIPEGPGMWYLQRAAQFRRTVPLLQMDQRNPEDIDTDGEDHTGDESRYAAMSVSGGVTIVSR